MCSFQYHGYLGKIHDERWGSTEAQQLTFPPAHRCHLHWGQWGHCGHVMMIFSVASGMLMVTERKDDQGLYQSVSSSHERGLRCCP